MENNNDWMKTLKAGDEVGVSTSYGSIMIKTVKKITPTGRIKLEGTDRQYSPDGIEMGDVWNRSRLFQVADYYAAIDKKATEDEKRKLVDEIRNFKMMTYSIEDLNKILAVLKKEV